MFGVRFPSRLLGLVQDRAIPVPGITRDIQVKIAANADEWEQAFRLVANNYQARSFEAGNADYRFTAYHALPDTAVLVAKEGERVLATFSNVADSTLLGLPSEDIYRREIQELRRQGKRIFETTCLADHDLGTREFVQVFLTLIRLIWQYRVSQAGSRTTSVITVNPRHVGFYTKVLGYVPLGPRRACHRVNSAPAEAFYLDGELMRSRAPRVYQQLFGEPLPRQCLLSTKMPTKLVRHFSRHSSQTSLGTVEQILWHEAQGESLRRW